MRGAGRVQGEKIREGRPRGGSSFRRKVERGKWGELPISDSDFYPNKKLHVIFDKIIGKLTPSGGACAGAAG